MIISVSVKCAYKKPLVFSYKSSLLDKYDDYLKTAKVFLMCAQASFSAVLPLLSVAITSMLGWHSSSWITLLPLSRWSDYGSGIELDHFREPEKLKLWCMIHIIYICFQTLGAFLHWYCFMLLWKLVIPWYGPIAHKVPSALCGLRKRICQRSTTLFSFLGKRICQSNIFSVDRFTLLVLFALPLFLRANTTFYGHLRKKWHS